jgi:6-phosphofructokinase 2
MNPSIDLASKTEQIEIEGRKTRCFEPREYPGGGGINVARGVTAEGGEALAIYPSGRQDGERLRALLQHYGVASKVVPIEGAIRRNLSINEEGSGRHLHLVFPGPSLSEPEWRACADAVAEVQPAPRYVVLSGSLPPDVPANFYADVAARCSKKGSHVIVDTSGEALQSVLGAQVFLLKINRREFAQLFGIPARSTAHCIRKMAQLVADGVATAVVVTVGAEGALLVSADRRVQVRPPPTEGRSPVGAGDSLVAALVQQLATGSGLVGALKQGVAAAAAAVKTGGTELYRPQEVRRIRSAVRVEDMSGDAPNTA